MTKAKGKSTTTGASKAKGQKSSSTDRSAKNDQLNSIIIYGCLVIVLLFVFFIRLRLIDFPLERDEGEYALMGQLILKGIPPYEMAYNMKLPGVYYMYALIMSIFGQTPTGIHLGLLLVNLSSTFLLFIIGKKLGNGFLGVFAAGTFGLLSLSPSHLGFAAHATQFIVAFGLAGFLTLIYYIERPRLWMLVLSGFCFGLAFIMKQQAIFLLLFGLIVFGIDQWQRKPFQPVKSILRGALYGTSMTVPYLLVVLIAVMTGSFDQFWHWTMEYAREYAGIKTMGEAVTNFTSTISNVSEGMQLFWWVGLIGLILLFFTDAVKPHRWTIFLFALLSFACVVPGFYFRRHYYIVFHPALGLLVGVTLIFIKEQLEKNKVAWLSALPVVLFAMMFGNSLNKHKFYFFKISTQELCKVIYSSSNPFVEAQDLGAYLKSHTTPEDKIAILGSEPEICFYSDREPATGYIYTYPLTETQPYSEEMRKDMMAEIEKSNPKYLIFINSNLSWGSSSEAVKDITDWYIKMQEKYNMVCLIDLNETQKGTYVWGDEAKSYKPKNPAWIWVHERK